MRRFPSLTGDPTACAIVVAALFLAALAMLASAHGFDGQRAQAERWLAQGPP